MNRRDFLKYSALTAVGFFAGQIENKIEAAQMEDIEPIIKNVLLHFTEYEKRPATEAIVIHHTGFEVDKDSSAEKIHEFHQKVNGWAGIGYHYLIRKDGRIEQGRLPDMVGAHVLHHNKTSIGVSLAGNFDLAEPTEQQIKSLKKLTAWLCKKYELNPAENGIIIGHRDYMSTSCPGKNLYSKLKEVRKFCREVY